MPTAARAARGTLLQIGDGGGPEVFTTIAEVKDIQGPSFASDTVEVTNHDSSAWKEYVTTLKDGEDVTFDVNFFNHTTHQALWTDFNSQVRRNFKIVFPLSPVVTLAFAAYVSNIGHAAPVADVLSRSVTLKVTGQPTWS